MPDSCGASEGLGVPDSCGASDSWGSGVSERRALLEPFVTGPGVPDGGGAVELSEGGGGELVPDGGGGGMLPLGGRPLE